MSHHPKQHRGAKKSSPPIDLEKLRDELVALTRRQGSGKYRPKICPVCGEDRHGERWVGRPGDPDRMCERCFTEGRAYPKRRSGGR